MRPTEVEQLITDLKAEKPTCHSQVQADSQMVVVIEETGERLVFSSEECALLLSGTDSVDRLFETLDYPDEVFVELHDLTIDPEVMVQLESFASTVDEM